MAISVEQKKIIDSMRSLGTYKPEYLPTVSRLAKMKKQYETLQKMCNKLLKQSPEQFAGYHKPVMITTMESLRRDILAYEKDLGLTPAALRKMDAASPQPTNRASPTQRLLQSLDDDVG